MSSHDSNSRAFLHTASPTFSFLRCTSIAAWLAVVTTILNTQLPRFYTAPTNFEESVALVNNAWYMARQWVVLLHPFGTLVLAVGLAVRLWHSQRGLALTGVLFVLMEKFLEFVGATIQLFTVNLNWKTAYLAATDAASKAQLKQFITFTGAVWNDCFFVLWVSYILASLCFGIALWFEWRKHSTNTGSQSNNGWTLWTSLLLFASALMTAIMLLSDYGKQAWLQPALPLLYPLTMVASRALIAVFLWNESDALDA
jgi:hypothetical protein